MLRIPLAALYALVVLTCTVFGTEYQDLANSFGTTMTLAGIQHTNTTNPDGTGINFWTPEYEDALASTVSLSNPHMAAADAAGNIYIADKASHSILRIAPDGHLHTFAGTHVAGFNGDGPAPAGTLQLDNPNGLFVFPNGIVYLLDPGNHRIRRVDTNGLMSTIVVDTTTNWYPSGRALWVSADEQLIYYTHEFAPVPPSIIADGATVKQWTSTNGIETVCGKDVGFRNPANLAVNPVDGKLYVTDRAEDDTSRLATGLFRIDGPDQRTRITGDVTQAPAAEGRLALYSFIEQPRGIAFRPDGSYFLCAHKDGSVWFVDTGGIIHRYLRGRGSKDYYNIVDGLHPPLAGLAPNGEEWLSQPRSVTLAPNGDLLIVCNDSGYLFRVARRIPPSITTQPTNQIATVGSNTTFVVLAAGTAPLTCLWQKGATLIQSSSNATFTITGTQLSDAGAYSVVITNAAGSVTSSVFTLKVNLPDLSAPTLTVASPSTGFTRVHSNSLNVAGIAADRQQLREVVVRARTTTNTVSLTGTTAAWTVTAPLEPGTNLIRITALDLAGNSVSVSKIVFFSVLSPITLITNGAGSVRGATNLQRLEVGQTYSLTAAPGTGQVFSNWSGDVNGSAPVLHVVMQSNLVVAANFVTNPFPAWAGSYNGLFYEPTGGVRHGASGFIKVALRPDGGYSGKLQQGTRQFPFAGRFDLEGHSTFPVKRAGTNDVMVDLMLDLHGTEQITGSISDGSWNATVRADRAVFNAKTRPATNYANNYTLLIPGSTNLATEPFGDGFGSAVVDLGGTVKLMGVLADGSPIAQSVSLSKSGSWPLYVPLYSGRGSVLGCILITNSAQPDLGGVVRWSRPAGPLPRVYTNGFAFESPLMGSYYRAPGTNTIFGLTEAIVSFNRVTPGDAFTNHVTLESGARVTNVETNKLNVTLTQKTGWFAGTVTPPGATKPVSFKSAILQKQGYGGGFFLGTNQSGRVYFGP